VPGSLIRPPENQKRSVYRLMNEAAESSALSQAAAELGRLPRLGRKVWTGFLAGQRAWRGRKVILPDGRVAAIYCIIRGKAGLVWDDPTRVEGLGMKLITVEELKLFKSPAAVIMGRAKRGVREAHSEAKVLAARSNGCKPPRPGKQRGRPRKHPAI
jgi:hypothetical protein